MRYSRLVRIFLRFFLLILASTMSFVSFLGGYSALLILGDEDNIDLDVDVDGELFTNRTDFEIEIKFTVYNEGYFALEDLEIKMELVMVYYRNFSGTYREVAVTIFDDDKSFKTIPAGTAKENKWTIEFSDLLYVDWVDIYLNADRTKDLSFQAFDIEINAKYSLGLIAFDIDIEQLDVGDYDI